MIIYTDNTIMHLHLMFNLYSGYVLAFNDDSTAAVNHTLSINNPVGS